MHTLHDGIIADDETELSHELRGITGKGSCCTYMMSLIRVFVSLLEKRFYVVCGDSMKPALESGDQVIVDLAICVDSMPSRGDMVVFQTLRIDGRHDLKRIVGLPGEVVSFQEGMLWVGEVCLEERYLRGLPSSLGLGKKTWKLGSREYFVLGDNRLRSTDSREMGPIDKSQLIGKVRLRYWPLHMWGSVK